MKKGFTLIELLAVIVILAIVALIAIPTISGIVEKARKGSVEQSAKGYVDAVDKQIALNLMDSDETNDINEGVLDAPFESKYNVKVKGQAPKKGWVEVVKNGVNRYSLVVGNYVVSYDGSEKTVVKGNEPIEKPSYDTIIYTTGTHPVYIGDKIDLENNIHNQYKKYVSQQADPNYGKVISINETSSLDNSFSLNLNDVLEIPEGGTFDDRKHSAYLKYALDKSGIIKKAEGCLITSWGTICLAGAEGVYNEATDTWNDSNYESKKSKLLTFFKWDTSNNTSGYNGVSCSVSSTGAECTVLDLTIGLSKSGRVYSDDKSAIFAGRNVSYTCHFLDHGSSRCWNTAIPEMYF